MQNAAIIGSKHIQQLFKGILKNITEPQALVQTLCHFIAHTQFTDKLVGAFIQLGILKRSPGRIGNHREETQVNL
ncbi:hypothetical protein D3C73_1629010 [compost metagenome]